MTRVAVFVDGEAHLGDLPAGAASAGARDLAAQAVDAVGGGDLVAARWFVADAGGASTALAAVAAAPGVFVHRVPVVAPALVAELVAGAAQGTWDVAVVLSPDPGLAPGLDAAHRFGRKVWTATVGPTPAALVHSAWGTARLDPGLARPNAAADADGAVLRELRRAEAHFEAAGGFLGVHFFLHRWRGPGLPQAPAARSAAVDRLERSGRVEVYQVDGHAALRTVDSPGEE